jgi:hypothetical protein
MRGKEKERKTMRVKKVERGPSHPPTTHTTTHHQPS